MQKTEIEPIFLRNSVSSSRPSEHQQQMKTVIKGSQSIPDLFTRILFIACLNDLFVTKLLQKYHPIESFI